MIRSRLAYLPYIDGLRGIAVLAVVVYHLNAGLLPGGFVGVDVFFVISGFVVSRSTAALEGQRFGAVLAHFYAHRMVRIVPALVVCLVLTMLANALFIPQSWLSGTNEKTGLHAFFGLSNLVLAHAEGDYFAPKAGFNPFTHTWSLGVEEQFYLIFPAIFFFWLTSRRRIATAFIAAGCAASLICAGLLARSDASLGFYSLTSRFWELGAGVLLFQAMAHPHWYRLTPRARSATCILSLGCLGIGLATAAPQSTPFPGSLLPCLGTVGLLACLSDQTTSVVAGFLGARVLRMIGRASYALYLWHWPIFVLFRWTTGLESWPLRLAALVLASLAAIASTRWIEAPLRLGFATTRLSNGVVLACGLLALAGGFGAASAVLALRPALSISTVSRHRADWYQDFPLGDAAFPGCSVPLVDMNLRKAEGWSASRQGCTRPVTFARNLFVLGDSHATAYTVMLRQFIRETGAHLYLYSQGGCSFFGLRSSDSTDCAAFEAAATTDISRRLKPGDVIFLPSLRIARLVQEYAVFGVQIAEARMFNPDAVRGRQEGVARVLPILSAWSRLGARIVFEAPTPVFNAPPFRCADWFDRQNPICAGGTSIERAEIERLRAPVLAAFEQFRASVPHIDVWDPLPALCPTAICYAMRAGAPLFFDGDHLSGFGNRVLLPEFKKFITSRPSDRGTPPADAP